MKHLERFTKDELDEIQVIIDDLTEKYDTVESQEFVEECTLQASRLPYRIRKILFDLRDFL